MAKIKALPREVIDKIAAGEVIERPASVVKELIENSIDAGAKNIQVSFTDGGRDRIQVTDDGEGMTAKDLQLAVQSHTTSKLEGIEDLWRLTSLGFRGEALASIVSIARVSITSRTRDSAGGMRLEVEGGEKGELMPVGAPQGTTIQVQDLFYNTPARKKFLSDPRRETAFILQQAIPLALAHPEIRVKVLNNNKQVIRTGGRGEVLSAWGDIFNHEEKENFLELKPIEKNFVEMEVFLGLPPIARSTRRGIYLFVNGRPFYNRRLTQAVVDGYDEMLPPGKVPQALIFFRVNPIHLDINVHPTKREISFSQLETLAKNLTDLIKENLPQKVGGGKKQTPDTPGEEKRQKPPEKSHLFTPRTFREKVGGQKDLEVRDKTETPYDPVYRIFQVRQAYLFVEFAEGIYIIDQHAAHERLLYNQLQREISQKKSPRENLLTPIPISLDPTQVEHKEEIISYLEGLNFTIEEFGTKDLLLRSVPLSIKRYLKENAEGLIRDLIDIFSEDQKRTDLLAIQKQALKTMACHRAVKFGGELSSEESRQLVEELFSAEQNSTCPHGRPVFKVFNWSELERMFAR